MLRRIHRGFTLIELMLVVGVIAILVSLALPTYQNFTVRTKVAELVLAAGAFRTAVSEKAQQDGGILASSGVGLTVTPSGKVTGGSVTDDGIITVSGDAAALGTAVTIVMTPTLGADSKVIWTCSTNAASYKFVPPECRN
jgi:type IV pilus assembly protein PilA